MRASEPEPGALTSVVLAAGRGRRFEPLDQSWPKSLLPVLGRPLIQHQLAALEALGVRETVLVVGHLREVLERELALHPPAATRLFFIEQREPLGIAHALACAAELLTRPFLCVLGDIAFEAADLARIAAGLEGADAVLGVRAEEDPAALARNFAVTLERGTLEGGAAEGEPAPSEGWVRAVEEKPRARAAGLRGVGLYAFRPEFLECARATPPSALRGERELTDAIQRQLEGGARVRAVACEGRDFNLSEPLDLLAANLHALRASGRENWIDAEAHIEPGARLERAIVLAGASVAGEARLVDALVFPGERVPAGEHRSVVFAAGRRVVRG